MGSTGSGATSEWQKRVEDTWFGFPAVFDAAGERQGNIRVSRTVGRQDSGDPEIVVTNDMDFDGPVYDRIQQRDLVLRITDTGHGRVYDGRDFHGGGTPFGRLLLGQDFIVPWGLDTVVAVQVLPDGVSQVYSNLAYQGPRLVAALGGHYKVGVTDVEAFESEQREWGATPFAWQGRTWSGEVEVHDGTSASTESMTVSSAGDVLTLTGGGLKTPAAGAISGLGREQQYAGPQVFGNGMAYGPMLFGTRHVKGTGIRLTTRDVLLDGGTRLAVAYQHHVAGERALVVNGVLEQQGG